MLDRAETETLRPLDDLNEVICSKRTGEFIFASGAVEIHVYLQNGRIAWATDSQRPLEFMRRLMQRENLDADSVRQVVDSCRRDRLPLGETLIAWGLCSLESVRDALHEQLSLSLVALSRQRAGSTLFLERPQFRSYDERLTFEVSALLKSLTEPPPPERGADGEPVETGVFPVQRPLLGTLSLDVQVAAAASSATFVVTAPPGAAVDARVPQVLQATLRGDVDFVALREDDGGVVGFLASDGSHVFVGYTSGLTYGRLLLALQPFIVPSAMEARVSVLPRCPPRGQIEDALLARFEEVLDLGPGVLALAALSPSGELIYSVERAGIHPTWFAPVASDPALLEYLSSSMARLGLGVGAYWMFGAALADGSGRSVWTLIERGAPQGLGWGALTSALGRTKTNRRRVYR
ncbi:MAG: hypothetical protein KIT72_01305 [Polyangiaceae bacterium]|nr:hypothetical protein [Polyangiaceae bacterium]MCW5789033.1 hypothetical protein [Polyangiaceae bacterium]